MENNQDAQKGPEFAKFALPRIAIAVIVIAVAIGGLSVLLGLLREEPKMSVLTHPLQGQPGTAALPGEAAHPATALEPNQPAPAGEAHTAPAPAPATQPPAEAMRPNAVPAAPAVPSESAQAGHAQPLRPGGEIMPVGVAFVDAAIKPLDYEVSKRFWGWRPNDIIDVTDDVNYFQLGVLEVTRRTAVQLYQRLSRAGSADAFNPHLENAVNGLMITAERYWFPSPESKYKESLAELDDYRRQLITGKAAFYTRSDNLIPLLADFEDLLGSCDENLVKTKERDGSTVGFFASDNYFYYAQGVASAMATILEATAQDFGGMLEARRCAELLHHALVDCQRAAAIDPWIVFNGDPDGFLANHRANMAAPISHARYYLGQLIRTLST